MWNCEERKNGERWARAAMRILTNRSVPRLRCRGSLFWSPGGAPRLILRNVFSPTSRWVSACPHPHRVVFSSPRVLVDALRSFESLYIEFISTPRNTHISMTSFVSSKLTSVEENIGILYAHTHIYIFTDILNKNSFFKGANFLQLSKSKIFFCVWWRYYRVILFHRDNIA